MAAMGYQTLNIASEDFQLSLCVFELFMFILIFNSGMFVKQFDSAIDTYIYVQRIIQFYTAIFPLRSITLIFDD